MLNITLVPVIIYCRGRGGGRSEDFGCGMIKVTPPSVNALHYSYVSALLSPPENHVILQNPPPPFPVVNDSWSLKRN